MPKEIPHDRVCLTPLEREDLPMLHGFMQEAPSSLLGGYARIDALSNAFEDGGLHGEPLQAAIIRAGGAAVGYAAAKLELGAIETGIPPGTQRRKELAAYALRWIYDYYFSQSWHLDALQTLVAEGDAELARAADDAGLKPLSDAAYGLTRAEWERWEAHPVRDDVEDVPQGECEPVGPQSLRYEPVTEAGLPFLHKLFCAKFQFYNYRLASLHSIERRFTGGEFFGDKARVFIIRAGDEPVGIARLQDPLSASPEVGIRLFGPWQARGIGMHATKFIVGYAFEGLPRRVVKVRALTVKDNIGGNKALHKTGFKLDGIARKQWFIRGQWRDAALYSMLREEWEALR